MSIYVLECFLTKQFIKKSVGLHSFTTSQRQRQLSQDSREFTTQIRALQVNTSQVGIKKSEQKYF